MTPPYICLEDYQECWKCPRAIKDSKNPCMVGQLNQYVESIKEIDINELMEPISKEERFG